MNIIERFINIFVNNKEANIELDKTTQKLNNVDKATEEVTQKTDLHTQKTQQNSKSIRENAGLMGLLGAATRGASNDARDAIEAVEGLGISFKGLRGAIATTVIGLGALAILELVTNWDKWVKVINGSAEAMEKLNQQLVLNNKYSQENALSRDETIGKLEEELRLELAKNGETEKAKKLQADINRAKIDYYEKVDEFGMTEIDRLKAALEIAKENVELFKRNEGIATEIKILEERINGTRELAINQTKQEAIERLKSLYARIAESEEGKKLIEIQNKLNTSQRELAKLKNDPKVIQAEKARTDGLKRENELLKEQTDLILKNSNTAKNALNSIISINKSVLDLLNSQYGETFNNFMKISNLWYDNKDALDNYNKSIDKFNSNYNKAKDLISSSTVLNKEEKEEQLKSLEKTYKTEKEKILESISLLKLKGNSEEQINKINEKTKSGLQTLLKLEEEKINKTIDSNNKEGDQLKLINDIKADIIKSENKILAFETDKDGRLQNSTRFYLIENKINELYTNRERLLDQTLKKDAEKKKEEFEAAKARTIQLEDELKLEEDKLQKLKATKKALGIDVETDEEVRAQQRKQNEANAKFIASDKDLSEKSLAYKKSVYDYELELFALTEAKKTQLLLNTGNREAEEYAEKLERQKIYAEKSIAIAEESANMLDSIAAISGKKGQDFAKAALLIRKASGIASVAISTQEEIRGIWANPVLSALPDTGIAKKTLLTAAAAARAAISVATILSQKISSSPSASGAGGSTGAPANFNIVGASGTNQLAATIGAQQNRPVQAYVVGADVSTQAALDRARVNTATFL
jgi:cell division protein ZapA